VFILRMGLVPLVEASGVIALEEFLRRCGKRGIRVIISGLQPQVRRTLETMHILNQGAHVTLARNFTDALAKAAAA
jgi:SulP family sulfate permease